MSSVSPADGARSPRDRSHRAPRLIAFAAGWLAALTLANAAATTNDATLADSESAAQTSEFAAGHGFVSLGFQHAYYHGDFQGPAGPDSGNVSFFTYGLEVGYFVADHWEVHASVPYIVSSFSGPFPHPKLTCVDPTGLGCPPVLVDNGDYHGTLQDWDAGVRYHFDYNGLLIAPSLDLYVPSHNYPYYGTAAYGERTTKFGIGIELSHQFDFSNVFYRMHYQYVFDHHVLGVNNDYYTFGLDLGYFISPRLSVRAITDVRLGGGLSDDQLGAAIGDAGLASPYWILHDKFRLQEHGLVGGAVDYVFAQSWNLQATLEHALWGRSNGDLTYGIEFKLTRSF